MSRPRNYRKLTTNKLPIRGGGGGVIRTFQCLKGGPGKFYRDTQSPPPDWSLRFTYFFELDVQFTHTNETGVLTNA